MSAWNARERDTNSSGVVLGASVTKQPVGLVTSVTADGALHLIAAVKVTAATGSPTVLLQTAVDGTTWVDTKSATVSGTGITYISLAIEKAADQTYLPLLSQVRVVGSTAGGEALTVTNVWILQAV